MDLGKALQFVAALTRRALSAPFSWGAAFLEQFAFTVRVCLLPLVLSSFALSFGPMGVQASGFFETFGSFDRIGSLYQLVVVRERADAEEVRTHAKRQGRPRHQEARYV